MFDFIIDRLSFLLGVLTGGLLWWFWGIFQPLIGGLRASLGHRIRSVGAGLSTPIEIRFRNDILRINLENHLASPLFSLDEIALEPRLMAPPPEIIPDVTLPPDDVISQTIPYLPDWPELASAYKVRTLSLKEVIESGANLLLLGNPGSGKTFALSYLTVKISRRDPEMGQLVDLIPIMVHAADLILPANSDDPLDVIYNVLYEKVSTLVEAQLPSFLKTIFERKTVLLLVDGLDELPIDDQKPVVQFLSQIQYLYPYTRMIIAGSFEYLAGLETLNLTPFPLAAWNTNKKYNFIEKWGELWNLHLMSEPWVKKLPDEVDPTYLNGWLYGDLLTLDPLLLTLKVWCVYAGDVISPASVDAIEAYVRRMTVNVKNSRHAMEQLASQMTLSQFPILTRKQAGNYVFEFEDPMAPSDLEPNYKDPDDAESDEEMPESISSFLDDELKELEDIGLPPKKERAKGGKKISGRSVRRIIPEMVKSNLLIYRPDSKISFNHPVVMAYLTSCNNEISNYGSDIMAQPNWVGKRLAMEFIAAKSDVKNMVDTMLENLRDDALRQNLLHTARWVKHAPMKMSWRSTIMRVLASTLNNDGFSLGLRGRVLTALATSGDTGVSSLFKQMMSSPHGSVRHLGALGSGIIHDHTATNDLTGLLNDHEPEVGEAACLALVAIGSDASLKSVATALLIGSEDVQRASAEALSQNPGEGHPILKDGSTHEELLVRRAVVYGLGLVNEPWAKEILQNMQIEDDQWVVRSTAEHMLEVMDDQDRSLPSPPPPLSETPWLISFASDRGMGISPGQASWDMLELALKEGNGDQRLAAMSVYKAYPKNATNIVPEIYNLLYGGESEIREAAFNLLWHLDAAEVKIPPPTQFGLG
jgi:HEAT repeat protein